MNNNHAETPSQATVGLNDILYLFFRHKWKIMFFSVVGLGAAAVIYWMETNVYNSEAKVMVRYITEKRNPLEVGPGEKDVTRPSDPRDLSVMNAEMAILRSSDSIYEAIKAVTARKILQSYGGGTNLAKALQLVLKNLDVDILGRNSGVMSITLTHKDPEIAQKLLTEIITQYQVRHQKIHDSGATYAEIVRQTENVKKQLADTEIELRRQKKEANIANLEQAKIDFSAQTTDLRKNIFLTEAELAQSRALVDDRKGNAAKGTNEVSGTEAKDKPQTPSSADLLRYSQLSRKLAGLRATESDLLSTFSESSKRVQQVRQEITDTEEQLNKLPIDPAFLLQLQAASNASGSPASPGFDFEGARSRIAALEARYDYLIKSLARVREESARVDLVEASITQLERKRKIEEEEYAYYMRSLDEMRVEQTIEATRRNNISIIQAATSTPPDPKKVYKKAGAAAAGGVGFGFALAFLLDFVFFPSVKRSKELEASLGLPVLAAIPDFGRKLKRKKAKTSSAVQKSGMHSYGNGEIAPWEENDPMLPYYEAVRDRVVMSYAGDLHKPKIVGLTSCNKGSGVSRIATGLAASLSRDAERNVLLVGLERNKVAVSAFAKGRPTDGLEAPPQDSQTEKELVAQNLYSLATTGHNLAGASVVQSFSDLLPKLKLSEYDYIIFDLPPLTQTSGSLRLASQMERTLLVVEAEETAKEKVKRARNLLKSSHANLFAVLNKSRAYGPKSIQDDI